MRCAVVYSNGAGMYVRARAVWPNCSFDIGPVQKLGMDCSDSELGEALVNALDESRDDLPFPKHFDGKRIFGPMSTAAGGISERTFQYEFKGIMIYAEFGICRVLPDHPNMSTQQREDAALRVASNCSDERLGRCVRDALAASRSPRECGLEEEEEPDDD